MTDEAGDPELRRRAAWLLGALVVAAVAVVVALVTLLHTPAKKHTQAVVGPDDSLGAGSSTSSSTRPSTSSTSSSTASTSSSSATSSASQSPQSLPPSCRSTCIVNGDVGSTIDAVNAYRVAHGRKQVSGSVSDAAQKCAKTNGDSCPLEFAETSIGKPSGQAAAKKLGHRQGLLDADMRSFQVGWAYDPKADTYYVALIKLT